MKERMLLHSGPPVNWERMSDPQRGAVMGAAVLEGWADTAEEAAELARRGEIEFSPCHEHDSVGPMAGIISPSMSVYVVKNEVHGNMAYCNLNEGLGKVLRYGAYSEEVLDRLRWMEEEMAPLLAETLKKSGPVDLMGIIAKALHMGDELHCRNTAASFIFLKTICPYMVETGFDRETVGRVMKFMGDNELTFLQLSMAAAKAALDAGHGIEYSTVVTTMARNGTDFGIRVSGLPGQWFTAPSPYPKTLFFPGFKEGDQGRDLGDSAIMETLGLGNFACICAPAVVQVVGGTVKDAENFTKEMREITIARHRTFTIPYMNFEGTSLGIDLRKVVETGIEPSINTGVSHRNAGIGGVGFGLVRAPMECFKKALIAFAEKYG
ncbi:MAG: DUF1116 domain-containing protein [Candidatus Hadarchaeum sp.]